MVKRDLLAGTPIAERTGSDYVMAVERAADGPLTPEEALRRANHLRQADVARLEIQSLERLAYEHHQCPTCLLWHGFADPRKDGK